jgi:hypothetical protein
MAFSIRCSGINSSYLAIFPYDHFMVGGCTLISPARQFSSIQAFGGAVKQ